MTTQIIASNQAHFRGREREPGTHCLHMRQNSHKSWEFIFLSIYQSVNLNLNPRSMPKNHVYWPRFGVRTLVATNLAITSDRERLKKLQEGVLLIINESFLVNNQDCRYRQLSNRTCQVSEAREGLLKVRRERIKSSIQQSLEISSSLVSPILYASIPRLYLSNHMDGSDSVWWKMLHKVCACADSVCQALFLLHPPPPPPLSLGSRLHKSLLDSVINDSTISTMI